ncbi:MAG: hypothetical protein IKT32_04225 [Clostridia bacterium]|nr:hypothetical protein [Clostridia bacterium]
MKKGNSLILLLCLLLSVTAFSARTVFASEQKVYTNEVVTDIAEFVTDSAILNGNGISVSGDGSVAFERNLGDILNSSVGIAFNTVFESSNWNDGAFIIKLGASEIAVSVYSESLLRVDVYNRVRTQSANGQLIKALLIPAFDLTACHSWKVARVFDSANPSNYALRLYVDNLPVLDVEDSNVLSESYQTITIINDTNAKLSLSSTLDEVVFEEENSVLDIMQFSADAQLLDSRGKILKTNEYALNCEGISKVVNSTGGVKFRMMAIGAHSSGNLAAVQIGATLIKLALNESNLTATITDNAHSDYSTISTSVALVSGYDATAWHEWKIVRVKAINAGGYALRIFIDNELVCESYLAGNLVGDYDGAKIYNLSSVNLAIKALLYSRPLAQNANTLDIVAYSGNAQLIDGLALSAGDKALEIADGLCETSYGVDLSFKASANFATAGDKLAVTAGTSKVSVRANSNGELSIVVKALVGNSSVFERVIPLNSNTAHTSWHSLTVKVSRFIHPSGALNKDGYQVSVWFDGNKVCEIIEIYSPAFADGYNSLIVENCGNENILVKANLSSEEYSTMLNQVKADKKEELDNALNQLGSTNYSTENWNAICAIVENYKSLISSANAVYEINGLTAAACGEIDAVDSIADGELKALKASAKAEINAYANQADYCEEAWANVSKYIERAVVAIDEATSAIEVQNALNAAKNTIDKVWTEAQKENYLQGGSVDFNANNENATEEVIPQPAEQNGSSCTSSMISSAFVSMISLLLSAMVVALKRNKNA